MTRSTGFKVGIAIALMTWAAGGPALAQTPERPKQRPVSFLVQDQAMPDWRGLRPGASREQVTAALAGLGFKLVAHHPNEVSTFEGPQGAGQLAAGTMTRDGGLLYLWIEHRAPNRDAVWTFGGLREELERAYSARRTFEYVGADDPLRGDLDAEPEVFQRQIRDFIREGSMLPRVSWSFRDGGRINLEILSPDQETTPGERRARLEFHWPVDLGERKRQRPVTYPILDKPMPDWQGLKPGASRQQVTKALAKQGFTLQAHHPNDVSTYAYDQPKLGHWDAGTMTTKGKLDYLWFELKANPRSAVRGFHRLAEQLEKTYSRRRAFEYVSLGSPVRGDLEAETSDFQEQVQDAIRAGTMVPRLCWTFRDGGRINLEILRPGSSSSTDERRVRMEFHWPATRR